MKIQLLVAVACSLLTLRVAEGCEGGCRAEPNMFLAKRYKAVMTARMETLPKNLQPRVKAKITGIMKELEGRGKVIDKTIFNKFRGTCVPPGLRPPSELCGSAKSIACNAAWGENHSVFDSVHKAVGEVIERYFEDESNLVQETMVEDVLSFCPANCDDWVEPFQNIMLVWEQREHPNKYRVTPNCLPLNKGGI